MCFFAFGEEISWGQHLFDFKPSELVMEFNKQKEYNFHNLNIARIMGMSQDSFMYPIFKNFTKVLNPLFYLICATLWVLIPLLVRKKYFKLFNFISEMPIPSQKTSVFFTVSIIGYLIIDKLFFDVGEIFELALSMTALMASLDLLLKYQPLPESFDKDGQ